MAECARLWTQSPVSLRYFSTNDIFDCSQSRSSSAGLGNDFNQIKASSSMFAVVDTGTRYDIIFVHDLMPMRKACSRKREDGLVCISSQSLAQVIKNSSNLVAMEKSMLPPNMNNPSIRMKEVTQICTKKQE